VQSSVISSHTHHSIAPNLHPLDFYQILQTLQFQFSLLLIVENVRTPNTNANIIHPQIKRFNITTIQRPFHFTFETINNMEQLQARSLCLRFGAIALVFMMCLSGGSAWSSNQKAFRSPRGKKSTLRYMPPSTSSSQIPHITAQKMLKNPGSPRMLETTRKSSVKLSNSVLASCDTLPSFPTAHGILSPETVMRMERLNSHGHRSDALDSFLDTYRQHGPLSCLPMLSDPDVLPYLTEAMRDVAL
jgi:hypothetical protein